MAIIIPKGGVPKEPRWVPLGQGVKLLCVSVTSLTWNIARARAEAILVDLAAAGRAVTRLGGQIIGAPNLDNEPEVEASRRSLVLLSIAEIVSSDWSGLMEGDPEDKPEDLVPIAFDPARLAELILSDPDLTEEFARFCSRPIFTVVEEGKD